MEVKRQTDRITLIAETKADQMALVEEAIAIKKHIPIGCGARLSPAIAGLWNSQPRPTPLMRRA